MKEINEKLLGVLGGMGPLATQLFYRMIIEKNDAHCDQDHLNMIILNHASMPDRSKSILSNNTKELFAKLLSDAKLLEKSGVDYIAIPCNTSHYFIDSLQKKISVPIINMIEETVGSIDDKVTKVGILATDGTINSGLYQNACIKAGFIPIIPSEKSQKLIMKIIYDGIKDGGDIDIKDFEIIDKELKDQGCNCSIMACTELSCFKEAYHISDFYIDALSVLSIKSLEYCGKKLKGLTLEGNHE